jgi:hypothetical protein
VNRGRSTRLAGALAAATIALAACGGATATFSPDGPCLADGRVAGAYPALEALLPTSLGGAAPTSRDSGRDCSDAALGILVTHDVHDLRFAGVTWDEGGGDGTTVAVLALPSGDLPVAWAEEFYQAGAEAARNTANITTARPTYPGVGLVFRLDTLNDLSFQTVIVWTDGPRARVVLVATQVGPDASRTAHDARVAAAVAAAWAAQTGG